VNVAYQVEQTPYGSSRVCELVFDGEKVAGVRTVAEYSDWIDANDFAAWLVERAIAEHKAAISIRQTWRGWLRSLFGN
jgi:transcription elongation factor Elf1